LDAMLGKGKGEWSRGGERGAKQGDRRKHRRGGGKIALPRCIVTGDSEITGVKQRGQMQTTLN